MDVPCIGTMASGAFTRSRQHHTWKGTHLSGFKARDRTSTPMPPRRFPESGERAWRGRARGHHGGDQLKLAEPPIGDKPKQARHQRGQGLRLGAHHDAWSVPSKITLLKRSAWRSGCRCRARSRGDAQGEELARRTERWTRSCRQRPTVRTRPGPRGAVHARVIRPADPQSMD